MARQHRDNPDNRGPTIRRPSLFPPGLLWFLVLAGVGVLLFFGIENWTQTRRMREGLDERLAQIDTRLTQLSAKVDAVAKARPAAAPQRRGPDPNKVYQIKTDGAPFIGPKDAPVTIAEFSDFQ